MSREDIVNQIAKTRDIIRKKYDALKHHDSTVRHDFTKMYEPMIDPLKKIASVVPPLLPPTPTVVQPVILQQKLPTPATSPHVLVKKPKVPVGITRKRRFMDVSNLRDTTMRAEKIFRNDPSTSSLLTPARLMLGSAKRPSADVSNLADTTTRASKTSRDDDDEENWEDTGDEVSLNQSDMEIDEDITPELPPPPPPPPIPPSRQEVDLYNWFREYTLDFGVETVQALQKLLIESDPNYDSTFGPRWDPSLNKLMIGNKPLRFDKDNRIYVAEAVYNYTEGLFELLFKKKPLEDVITEHDKVQYGNLINQTSVHRVGFKRDGRPRGSPHIKWKKFISPYSDVKKSGSGLMRVTTNPIDYVHWDDPNELVERLELLIRERDSGHTNHNNEIESIIEELIEARIIIN